MISKFQELLGSSPRIKIIEFLLDNPEKGWALIEIRDGAQTSYTSVKNVIPSILKQGLIVISGHIGKIKFYSYNQDHPIANDISALHALQNEL